MRDAENPSSFGALLRHPRRAAGLTQEQLAERCGLGRRSIQNLERDDNRPHRETLRLLTSHLALAAEERAHFEAAAQPIPRGPPGGPNRIAALGLAVFQDAGRLADPGPTDQAMKLAPQDARLKDPAADPLLTVPNNLPFQWTSFVGRAQPMIDVLQHRESTHLLTLTGTGGCGKTRLAIEVAKRWSDSYPDGVWLIDLAPLTDPTLIAQTAASTIGVREAPGEPILRTLVQHLRAKRVFLVFDNCEHLIEGSAQVVDAILRSCPRVSALGVGEIAARLDDRFRLLTGGSRAARLDDRFRLLTGGSRAARPRQQTLRATVDWSYGQLSEPERGLFRRLAVFVGGWTLAAAEVIGSGTDIHTQDVLDLLARLVDRSLVVVEKGVGRSDRYRLLETLRQYGLERLAESGEAQAVQRRHAAFYRALAKQAEATWYGPGQETWLDRLEADRATLRMALQWLQATGDLESGLRMGVALGDFWFVRGPLTEGRDELRKLLAAPVASVPRAMRAQALGWLAELIRRQGDRAAASVHFTESLAIYRELGARSGESRTLASLGNVEFLQGRYASARGWLEEGLAIARELADHWNVGYSLEVLGEVALMRGDVATARHQLDEALTIARDRGDRTRVTQVQHGLGNVALAEGNYAESHGRFCEALAMARDGGDQTLVSQTLTDLASLAAARGQPVRALRLAGASAARRAVFGYLLAPTWSTWYERWLEPAHRMLGENARTAAWAEGQAMTLEEAIAYAMSEEAHDDEPG